MSSLGLPSGSCIPDVVLEKQVTGRGQRAQQQNMTEQMSAKGTGKGEPGGAETFQPVSALLQLKTTEKRGLTCAHICEGYLGSPHFPPS